MASVESNVYTHEVSRNDFVLAAVILLHKDSSVVVLANQDAQAGQGELYIVLPPRYPLDLLRLGTRW
jgi:hypothetical protein